MPRQESLQSLQRLFAVFLLQAASRPQRLATTAPLRHLLAPLHRASPLPSMSAEILDYEPRELFQATTVKWSRDLSDYPASAGWQLAYSIKYGATTHALAWATEVTATGDTFYVTIPATKITALTANQNARLLGTVTKAGEVFAIYEATLKVKVAGVLSEARQGLAAIEAALLSSASRQENQIQVSFPGGTAKSLGLCSKVELQSLWRFYKSRVDAEDQAELAAQGRGTGRMSRVRFTTPT